MRYVVGIGLLLLLAGCGANSDELKQLQESQRQMQAKLTELEKKVDQLAAAKPAAPARPQMDPNKVYDIPAGTSPFKGPADAPVVVTEFSDFQCPFCARATSLLDQVVSTYPKEVKFVYKQFPLISIHQNALNASKAALAAQKQGKFWEMYNLLFTNQHALQPENLKQYAQQIGLDADKFDKDMQSPEVQQQIDADLKLGAEVGVGGTPTIYVNGKRLGTRSLDSFKLMIDEALKQKPA
ncbi:MAG TPA: thioredoxin domain-containing protein [Candidatus Acidoferrales bacterium]|nr:thioredoxin domain-containing protein [Candidatus Acidoferrales bacterium]